ncbi:MAG: hypothetical protein ABEJ81_08110 [Haloferacaceae archaeon]
MDDIAEKRVYADRRAGAVAYVASESGLVWVGVAADRIGRFGLARRESVGDVAVVGRVATAPGDDGGATAPGDDGGATATGDDGGATATGDDGGATATGDDGGATATADGTAVVAAGADVLVDDEPTGFGTAVAVGADAGGAVLAADDGGRVARLVGEADGSDEWVTLGRVGAVRAVDAGLVAAADGVFRATADGLAPAGLTDARDVAGGGRPLAATGDGLYALGNGWLSRLDGPFRAVAAAADGRALAVGDAAYARPSPDDEWERVDLPADVDAADVVDVGFGRDARYAVTADGVVLADAGDGWRRRSLGVAGVRRLAVDASGADADDAGRGGSGGDATGDDEEKAV